MALQLVERLAAAVNFKGARQTCKEPRALTVGRRQPLLERACAVLRQSMRRARVCGSSDVERSTYAFGSPTRFCWDCRGVSVASVRH